VPTTVAMPIAAHNAIMGQIMRTLNGAGYWSKQQLAANPRIQSRKTHGFDMTKLTPSSLFYLPCRSEHPEGSFFINHDGPGRNPLDPYVWAGYAANHHRPEPERPPVEVIKPVQPAMPPTSCPKLAQFRAMMAQEQAEKCRPDREQRRAAAIARWRSAGPNEGSRAFFQLGMDLRGIGFGMDEIESILQQEASYARHPAQRRDPIKSVMRALSGSARRMAA
jgi:hypothetical protein